MIRRFSREVSGCRSRPPCLTRRTLTRSFSSSTVAPIASLHLSALYLTRRHVAPGGQTPYEPAVVLRVLRNGRRWRMQMADPIADHSKPYADTPPRLSTATFRWLGLSVPGQATYIRFLNSASA